LSVNTRRSGPDICSLICGLYLGPSIIYVSKLGYLVGQKNANILNT
jgi:hypothetical protein